MIDNICTAGKVYVNGKVINKAGTPVSEKSVVEIMAEIPKYVCRWSHQSLFTWNNVSTETLTKPNCFFGFLYLCRAGHKLEGAIEQLGVDVAGKVALDSGLSTGGFTDCLLQYGASHVYGVDVGYGQVTYLTLLNSLIVGWCQLSYKLISYAIISRACLDWLVWIKLLAWALLGLFGWIM